MVIKNFENSDIENASKVAHLVWGDLYSHESIELQKLIYDFMVSYYDLNREYSFSVFDDGFKGFLLASLKNDCNESQKKFKDELQKLENEQEQKIGFELLDYLDSCGQEVKKVMNDDDIVLNLFISRQKGCGKALLEKLTGVCYAKNIKNIYLWTDTTCDYEYYKKNSFDIVKELNVIVNSRNIKTIIYKKSII